MKTNFFDNFFQLDKPVYAKFDTLDEFSDLLNNLHDIPKTFGE